MERRYVEGAAPRRILSNFTSVFRFVSQIIKEKTGSHPSLFSQNAFFTLTAARSGGSAQRRGD